MFQICHSILNMLETQSVLEMFDVLYISSKTFQTCHICWRGKEMPKMLYMLEMQGECWRNKIKCQTQRCHPFHLFQIRDVVDAKRSGHAKSMPFGHVRQCKAKASWTCLPMQSQSFPNLLANAKSKNFGVAKSNSF